MSVATEKVLPATYTTPEVAVMFGVDRPTIMRWVKRGQMPRPIRIGPRTVRWPRQMIDDLVSGRAESA